MRPGRVKIVAAFAALAILASAPAWSGEPTKRYGTFSDLNGSRIGVITGTPSEYIVNSSLDYTRISLFDTLSEMMDELKRGGIDCVVDDEPILRYITTRDPGVVILDRLRTDSYGLVFAKDNHRLRREFDRALRSMIADKKIEDMVEVWMRDEGKSADMPRERNGKGALRLGIYPEARPFAHIGADGNPAGIDVEIVKDVCRELGYGLSITTVPDIDALFDAVRDGKVDVIAACLSITEERQQLFSFSIPYYHGGTAVMVRAESVEP